jgi:hypothetical protein
MGGDVISRMCTKSAFHDRFDTVALVSTRCAYGDVWALVLYFNAP